MPDPDATAFGLNSVDTPPSNEPDPLSDDFEQAVEAQAAPEAPVEAPQATERPWEAETPPEPEGEPAPAEDVPQPIQGDSGRYGEEAYKKLQAAFTQSQMENRNIQARQTQVEQLLESLAPMFSQQMAATDPAFAQQLEVNETLRPLVEQQVAPMREQMEMAQQQAEAERVVGDFRARHPEVAAGSNHDLGVSQVMQELNLRAMNPDSLEIGYEAYQNPSLKTVLRANPTLIDSDDGMAYARMQAQQLFGSPPGTPPQAGTPQGTPAQQQAPIQATPRAFVETGGSGAPVRAAPGQRSQDEFDEAFDSWAGQRESPLFGSLFRG